MPLLPPSKRDPTKVLLRYKCPDIRTTLMLPGNIQTSMFSAVTHPTSPLYQFFFPSLQPLEVVKKIIASLDDRHSKTVYLPFYANLSPLSSLAPSFIRDLMQWVSDSAYSSSWSSLTRAWETGRRRRLLDAGVHKGRQGKGG